MDLVIDEALGQTWDCKGCGNSVNKDYSKNKVDGA